jgi:thioredoxin-related protein
MSPREKVRLKRIVVAVAAVMLLAPQVFAGPWQKSLVTAKKKAKQQSALIFVDMFADWCGWCHKMEQEVFPSEAFQNATDDKVLVRLNTEDGNEGTQLARQFGITTLPTFLLLTSDGGLAGVIRGYLPATDFVKAIDDTVGNYKEFRKRAAHESSLLDYKKRFDLAMEFRAHYELPDAETRLNKLATESGVPADLRDDAYYELAYTQMLQKRYDDALKTIHKFGAVQSKGETFEKSRLLAGDIYVTQGNYKLAINELKAFKNAFPKSQYIANIDVLLPQLEQRVNQR